MVVTAAQNVNVINLDKIKAKIKLKEGGREKQRQQRNQWVETLTFSS